MGSQKLVAFFAFRTASRSTTARPDSLPAPRIDTDGSTTPAGIWVPASYCRYELTSPSVTVVRRPWRVGCSACALMSATFCLRSSDSRLLAGAAATTAAPSATHAAARTTHPTRWSTLPALRIPDDSRRTALLWLTIGLSGARHQLELPALHVLFEHAELRLLVDAQHLVDRVLRLLHLVGDADVELRERLHLLAHLRFVGLRRVDELTQLLDQPHAVAERAAPHVEQRLEPRQELRELLVGELQLLLRLEQRVGVEHPLDFARRDPLRLRAFGRGCAALSGRPRLGRERRGNAKDTKDTEGTKDTKDTTGTDAKSAGRLSHRNSPSLPAADRGAAAAPPPTCASPRDRRCRAAPNLLPALRPSRNPGTGPPRATATDR